MTRINLVPPRELMDQHLFAEFREIKMVPKALARSLHVKSVKRVLSEVPAQFTLGTGHVKFFYDKGEYLHKRYASIRRELGRRGINYDQLSELDPEGTMVEDVFNNDWRPTKAAFLIIRSRIAEKIAMKPHWYRYHGLKLKEVLNEKSLAAWSG